MKSLLLYLLLVLVYSIDKIEAIYIVRGQGFIIHINKPENFGDIKNCRFQFYANEFITINLKNPLEQHKLENGEIVEPYSRTVCGIRVLNFSEASSGRNWTLEMENNLGQKLTKSFEVTAFPAIKYNFETKLRGTVGDTAYITCRDLAQYKQKFCRIVNLDTGDITNGCKTYHVIKNDTRLQCHALYWGVMVESLETIIIESIEKANDDYPKSMKEDETTITLTCNFPSKVSHCRADLPNKENSILIQDHLHNERYSALDSSVADGKCVLQIKKPILPKERGIWRIFKDQNSDAIPEGCLFYVGDSEQKIIQEELSYSNKKTVIEVANTTLANEKIYCKMPFPIKNCYIRDPEHKVHFLHPIYTKSNSLGYCSFRGLSPIAGEWICGAFNENEQEFKQTYEVIVKDREGEVVTKKFIADRGQHIQLLCQTSFNKPVDNCAFVDPKGKVYRVSNLQTDHQSRAKYFGDGLLEGHCGIQIRDLQESDYGTWSCQFNNQKFNINVENIPHKIIGEASAIGLGVGLGLASIIIIIAAAVLYRRRKIRREIEQQRTETISMSSRE